MRAELEVLIDTLRSLKGEGVSDVFVEDATLARLRERVSAFAAENPPSTPLSTTVPEKKSEIFGAKPAKVAPVASPASATRDESDFDPAVSAARVAAVPTSASKIEYLDGLRAAMSEDPVMIRHLNAGKKLVFGEGSPDAAVFFCGEAPGAEEEDSGRPFVGPAGQLLTKMIAATGLSREQVYIANILKWRPETGSAVGNRPPTPAEMVYALPYVAAQIQVVRPRVIVALGLSAVNGLFGFDPDRGIGKMRGVKLEFRGIPVVATYHPSYLLRNNTVKSKRAAWEDFLRMMEIAGLPISDRQRNYFLPKTV